MEPIREKIIRALPDSQRHPSIRSAAAFLAGAGIGAVLTYLLDPHQGPRRRAVTSDRVMAFSRASGRRSQKLLRHARNQLEGLIAITTDLLTPTGTASDRKLTDRIRARLGHVAEHASNIHLDVKQGEVCVKGEAAEGQVAAILSAIAGTRGVRSVTDQITRAQSSTQAVQ